MQAVLILLGLLDVALGVFHAWALTYVPFDKISTAFTWPENLFYLICTAVFFLAPVLGWFLWNRAPAYVVAAVVALPVVIFALTGDFNIRIAEA